MAQTEAGSSLEAASSSSKARLVLVVQGLAHAVQMMAQVALRLAEAAKDIWMEFFPYVQKEFRFLLGML